MPAIARPLLIASLLAVLALVVGLLVGGPSIARADIQDSIAAQQDAAAGLQAAISADTAQIDTTTASLDAAQARLDVVETTLAEREAELRSVERGLLAARARLLRLENRLRLAAKALAANLVASYEGTAPTALDVVVQANGFADLLERLDFLRRVRDEDASILSNTRATRLAVMREARSLGALELRDAKLAALVTREADAAYALKSALLSRQIAELDARAGRGAELDGVEAHIRSLRDELAAQEAQEARAEAAAAAEEQAAGPAGSGVQNGITVDPGGFVQPSAGAPEAVAEVIAAGNAIATLPYVYGGGHASFQDSAYDCSGSVSYALAAAGLVSAPMDSTEFESWGLPGPGTWITVYANVGHAFMIVDGWRFDTVALAEGGTRWSSDLSGEDLSDFVARHPPGL